MLRSPAFLVALATFVVVVAIAAIVLRDQAAQRFEVDFARGASTVLAEVESQAAMTSQDLQQTRSFVATTDPTPAQWYDWLAASRMASESWLDGSTVIRLVDETNLERFIARERAQGSSMADLIVREGATDRALVTRVSSPADEAALGADLFALPAAEALLRRSANSNEPAVGVLPNRVKQLTQLFGDRLGWDEEIGSVVALLPIDGGADSADGWIASEFDLEESLAAAAAARDVGVAIEFESDLEWASAGRIDVSGQESESAAALSDSRVFETSLLSGSVHVWSLSTPALSARDVFVATFIGAIAATLLGVGVLLLSRAIGLRRRLGESERELQIDPLTSLKSRVGLERELTNALEKREATGGCLAVMLLDIDRFKVVNDSLGHAVGDELLRAVGGRLMGGVSSQDVLGRFGGDEFVVIAPDLEDPNDAERIARRLERTLQAPIELGGRTLSVSASIGVAVARSGGGIGPEDLIRDADAAMYAAKRDGQNVRVFDASLRSRALDRLIIEEAVTEALENGWFELAYQPIVTMESGTLAGVEALVRMNHPTLGVLPPDRFLPVAREVGLMGRVGAEVIQMAVADAQRWNESFPDEPPLRISINLDESQAADPALVGFVAGKLDESGVDPSQICFELSEDALVEHLRECIPVLRQLVALGIELSVDDFGTGRSSLAHLRLLSFVSEVKIDRTFVTGLTGSEADAEIVGAIVDLAAALKARVVAEGVETHAQWQRLLDLGVSHAQGFFFARPQGADVADYWAGDHGRSMGDRFEVATIGGGAKKIGA